MLDFRQRLALGFGVVGYAVAVTFVFSYDSAMADAGRRGTLTHPFDGDWTYAAIVPMGVLGGVPVSFLAVCWFGLVVILGTIAARSAHLQPAVGRIYFLLSIPALAVVLWSLRQGLTRDRLSWAVGIGFWAPVVAIFLLTSVETLTFERRRSLLAWARFVLTPRGALVFVAYAVAVAASAAALRSPNVARSVQEWDLMTLMGRAEFARWFDSRPRHALRLPERPGDVSVVKFNDFECPPCRASFEHLRAMSREYERRYPGRVSFVTMDFPLERECNSLVPFDRHLAACEAAVAFRIARTRGQADADAMESWLFGHQDSLSRKSVLEQAAKLGFADELEREYSHVLEDVRKDVEVARRLSVRSTPTLFVNGVSLGTAGAAVIEAAIDYELTRTAPVRAAVKR